MELYQNQSIVLVQSPTCSKESASALEMAWTAYAGMETRELEAMTQPRVMAHAGYEYSPLLYVG